MSKNDPIFGHLQIILQSALTLNPLSIFDCLVDDVCIIRLGVYPLTEAILPEPMHFTHRSLLAQMTDSAQQYHILVPGVIAIMP